MDEIVIPALPDPSRSAEVVPHPTWTRRVADDVLRDMHDQSSPSWRRKQLTDAVRAHRKQLERIGVARHRIDAEVAALEAWLFPRPLRRRA
jgi:hypothetical protein